MRNRKGKLLTWMTWCVLAFCLSLLMASSARADMGPNGKKLRIILYAIVANLVSMVTSLYVGGPLGTRILFFVFMIIAYGIVLIIHSRKEKNLF